MPQTPVFRHKALYGFTGMGKTYLMKQYCKVYIARKQIVIVYPGTGDMDFPKGCKFVFSADELEAALTNPANYGAFVMIDEGAALYSEVSLKHHPTVDGLFMRGRHLGYTVMIATQYPTSIPPKVRINCGERFIFGIPDDRSANLIWRDCGSIMWEGKPLREAILQLKPREFFHYIHPAQIRKYA